MSAAGQLVARLRRPAKRTRGPVPYLLGVLSVALTSAAAATLWPSLTTADAAMLHLLPVLLCAVQFGTWPSVVTSIIAAFACNFLFSEPHFDFGFDDPHDLFTMTVFALTALTLSYWSGKAYEQGEVLHLQVADATRREAETDLLYRLNSRLAGLNDPSEIVAVVAREMTPPGSPIALFLAVDGMAEPAASAGLAGIDAVECRAACAALERRRPAGPGTGMYDDATLYHLPLVADGVPIGVLALRLDASWSRGLPAAIAKEVGEAIASERRAEERERASVQAAAGKLHTALLASVSHDFRTPLTTIIGAASSLKERDATFSSEARRALLTNIQRSGERLHRYVVNLLDASRLDQGAVTLKRDWCDLAELVGTALERVGSEYVAARVIADLPRGLPMLNVDYLSVEQVIVNLVDNAMKYAPAAATIRLSARDTGDTLALTISNPIDGPPPDPDHMFERFYRSGAMVEQSGTGLGLSICKGFAEANGAAIFAEVTSSTVTITLEFPLTAAARNVAAELVDD